jgi:ADP-ribose pyrophosphatase
MTWRQAPVYSTPWFSLVARTPADQPDSAPFYSLVLPDYVCVVARTVDQRILLVRQYRPAVEAWTLELPAGTVDPGETPEQSIRRELEEEAGYRIGDLTHLGTLNPDTGRLSNRMWCYWADRVEPVGSSFVPEEGVEPLSVTEDELRAELAGGRFDHALHLAAVSLAVFQGRIQFASSLSVK